MVQAVSQELMFEFQHDLEDGWYAVQLPTGKVETWGYYCNLKKWADDNNYTLKYIGHPIYDPTK